MSAQGEQLVMLQDMVKEQAKAIAELADAVRKLQVGDRKRKGDSVAIKLVSFGYNKKGPPRLGPEWKTPHPRGNGSSQESPERGQCVQQFGHDDQGGTSGFTCQREEAAALDWLWLRTS